MPRAKTRRKFVVAPDFHQRLFDAITQVFTGEQSRTDVPAEIDGKPCTLVIYRLNEFVPVRIDVRRNLVKKAQE